MTQKVDEKNEMFDRNKERNKLEGRIGLHTTNVAGLISEENVMTSGKDV